MELSIKQIEELKEIVKNKYKVQIEKQKARIEELENENQLLELKLKEKGTGTKEELEHEKVLDFYSDIDQNIDHLIKSLD